MEFLKVYSQVRLLEKCFAQNKHSTNIIIALKMLKINLDTYAYKEI